MTDHATADDYLERVKAEIRAEADLARQRQPLPRIDPPPRALRQTLVADGIDRDQRAYSIVELVGTNAHTFVDQAFRALLKRPADEIGMATHMKRLAAGGAKAEILGDLRWSPEGRHVGARVRGLLPRYLLAKATHLPLLGYAIEWALALAGLPMLMRHQRAADASVTARFDGVCHHLEGLSHDLDGLGQAHHQTHQTLERLQSTQSDSELAHARFGEETRTQFAAAGIRVDHLVQRSDALDQRGNQFDARISDEKNRRETVSRDLVELRHYVNVANHWVASLQRSLETLEAAAETHDCAPIPRDDTTPAPPAHHTIWAAHLARQLPSGAKVFDVGSGDGAWLRALHDCGIDGSGIDGEAAYAARARGFGTKVAVGDAGTILNRIEDASLTAFSLAAGALGERLDALRGPARVLARHGMLVVRIEPDATRASASGIDAEVRGWTDALLAAGFENIRALTDSEAAAIFAVRA